MSKLAVIVLNWNSANDAIACVRSLAAQTIPVDVILVDNASRTESIKQLESFVATENNPRITFIKNSVNSGYAGGNNVGFSYALNKEYDYIGTLNPDAVADKHWAQSLLDILDRKEDVGIAGGILARSNREYIDSTGDFYTTWGIPGPRGRDMSIKDAPQSGEYVFGITGGAFIARAQVLRDVGMFDEKFFMYYEDVDFCFRAQLAGFKIYYTPSAIAYHKVGASSDTVPGLATKQTFKNLPIVFIKNTPLGLWPYILPRFVLAYTLIFWHAVFMGRGKTAITGWVHSVLLLPYAFRLRWQIQQNLHANTQYISSIILHNIPPEQTGLRRFRSLFTRKPTDEPVVYPTKQDM